MSYSFYFFLTLILFLVFEGRIIKCIIDFRNQKLNTIEKTTIVISGVTILSIIPTIILCDTDFNTFLYPQWPSFSFLFFELALLMIYDQVWNRQAIAIQNKEPMDARRFSLALGWGLLNSFAFYLYGSSILFQLGNYYFHSETAINCKIVEAGETYGRHRTSYYYSIEPINERWEETLLPIDKDSIGEMDLFSLDLTQRMCVPLVLMFPKNDDIKFTSDIKNYKRQSELIGDTIEVGFLKGYFGDIARGKNPFLSEEEEVKK